MGAVVAVESGLSLARSAVAFMPGGLGVQDMGYATALAALGTTHETAAAFVILKRAKEIVWIAIGFAVGSRAGHVPPAADPSFGVCDVPPAADPSTTSSSQTSASPK